MEKTNDLLQVTGVHGENHRPVTSHWSTWRKPPTCYKSLEYMEKTTDLLQVTGVHGENHRPATSH